MKPEGSVYIFPTSVKLGTCSPLKAIFKERANNVTGF
jgi:hypothetical protein